MLYDAMTDDEGLTQEQVDAKIAEAAAEQERAEQAAALQQQIEALQQQQLQLQQPTAVEVK
ncbi:hypothetical protein D3C84_330260 [compost metagenome]